MEIEKENSLNCSTEMIYIYHCNNNFPHCLPYNSNDISAENLVLSQLIMP